jgi:protein-disulfide isomerase
MAQKKTSKRPATGAQARQAARAAAQAEAARLKAEQEAKAKRRRLISVIAGVVLVAVVATIIAVVVNSRKIPFDEFSAFPSEDQKQMPVAGQEWGGITLGQDMSVGGTPAEGDSVVTIRIYSDYICPGCAQIEANYGTRIQELVEAGQVKLELVPIAWLDGQSSGTEYSSRSTNAAMVVADQDPDKFWAFHKLLFENQPAEGSEGLDADTIADLARQAGCSETTIGMLQTREYDDWLKYALQQFQEDAVKSDGKLSTPAIMFGLSDADMMVSEQLGTVTIDQAVANVLAGLTPDGGAK